MDESLYHITKVPVQTRHKPKFSDIEFIIGESPKGQMNFYNGYGETPEGTEPAPEESESERYQREMREQYYANLGQPVPENVTEQPPPPAPINETPFTQFIDVSEYRAISEENIIIPENSNVIVIPVDVVKNSELFDEIKNKVEETVKANENTYNPPKPQDVVIEVVNDVLRQTDENSEYVIPEATRDELRFENVAVETKIDNPEVKFSTIEAALLASNKVPINQNIKSKDDFALSLSQETKDELKKVEKEFAKVTEKPVIKRKGYFERIIDNIYNVIYK